MALQMNVSGLRRNIKNIAHNYTDAQVKVREATSNDPWGPSSTIMAEIADLTYNVVAFSEIMQMVWKRLNDHGRNWRHVYKALVLLEYLIKTGSEKVGDQCKENIYAIQTLKDFQYLEENKDMGVNVREKAKSLVSLLKDDERLRNERVRALKAKERFAQSVSAIGNDSDINSPTSPTTSYQDTIVLSSARADHHPYAATETPSATELESARPQTIGEEELQLQLALAMSKEEADQEEAKRKSDDVRLQMALSQSETDERSGTKKEKSGLNDLLDINFNPNSTPTVSGSRQLGNSAAPSSVDPWGVNMSASGGDISPPIAANIFPQYQPVQQDPWGLNISNGAYGTSMQPSDPWCSPNSEPASRVTSPPIVNDPWNPVGSKSPETVTIAPSVDPWAPVSANPPVSVSDAAASVQNPIDPWKPVSNPPRDPFDPVPSKNGDIDEFFELSTRDKSAMNLQELSSSLSQGPLDVYQPKLQPRPQSKSPKAFLGENSNLVNLDNLVGGKQPPPSSLTLSSPGYPSLHSMATPTHGNAFESDNILNNNISLKPNHQQEFSNGSIPTVIASGSISSLGNGDLFSQSNPTNPFFSSQTDAAVTNPFSPPNPMPATILNSSNIQQPNPFQAQQPPKPSLNQMRSGGTSPWGVQQVPLQQDENPFMI